MSTHGNFPVDHLKQHVVWLNDKDAMRHSGQRRTEHTIGSQLAYLAGQNDSFHAYDIVIDQVGKGLAERMTAGTLSVYFDYPDRVCDMGIMIGPDYQGLGFGSEAWYGLYDFLLQTSEVDKVEAGCMEGNRFMQAICAQRMRFEGTRKNHFLDDDGTRHDLLLYGSE